MQKALEELKNMGYDDVGGWLAQLVVLKKGNVGEVLRALHPKENADSQGVQNV